MFMSEMFDKMKKVINLHELFDKKILLLAFRIGKKFIMPWF